MAVDGLITAERTVAEALLAHYRVHARRLPWRSPPGAAPPDPYAVWLSEIMLQQTTVAAVIPYYERFLARWPTVEALAAAQDGDLMAAWAGLGYYARARNLLACARFVAGELGGRFPDTEEGLRALPGIGAYTAAAIAAIAFGRRAVVVDGNVERVVSRLFAVETPLPAGKAELRVLADGITPERQAGDFAQAMMDLGATICTPTRPACLTCPLAAMCVARARGTPERYPVKAPKKAKPTRTGTAWWIEHDGAVWLVRRPDKGLLGGMLGLPTSDWREGAAAMALPDIAGDWTPLNSGVRHVFTHFALELGIARLAPGPAGAERIAKALGPGQWWPRAALAEAGLPTVFARVVQAVMALGED
ncbi:A/G-specific adenine glycosylase [Sphingobium nicotianae]|uniref:Adenine DNA glycosylase n=1 Tax=Sphingobium nicotianae TaxID=2782607 RepID=A0A9X1D9U1_9SPHN|nr:A/G-specific adenine glycosylase [Sphingobium nicotianae]MBT2185975.1 A/G-specific adenine glycosylase [Sphingobium nicotianae]